MSLARDEKDKYERAWRDPSYRKHSPGEIAAPIFADKVALWPGHSLTDWGCGPGRAARYFAFLGLSVVAFDIAHNCLDNPSELDFRIGCLWALPDDLPITDWAFCVDVLEHIPPQHVDVVIEGIARHTKRGGYFQIARFQDLRGARGETKLHLTVQESDWWRAKLSRHFRITLETEQAPPPRTMFIVERRR